LHFAFLQTLLAMISPAPTESAIRIENVRHAYAARQALNDVSFEVGRGEIFALLGPNGGGKSTLFRLLATLMPLQHGSIDVLGFAVNRDHGEIRRRIGVVFQSPSLDRKLTVWENIWHQAALYGLAGRTARQRGQVLLEQMGLADRQHELAERLSGGLRRRVELAKSMLHEPQLLLMDEPSTGLDPAARSDLWACLAALRSNAGVTVALTTHLLEEAAKADRIAILDHGRLVALDTPTALCASLGGDCITITTPRPQQLADDLQGRFQIPVQQMPGAVRFQQYDGHQWVAQLMEAFPSEIQSITLGKPTLEDVFIARTGHRFWTDET
jgi:ABC-2 type transport system ATP-binding protein